MRRDPKPHPSRDAPVQNGSRRAEIPEELQLLGVRWNLLILREVFAGASRFAELQRNLGISRKVLARRLNTLVGSGILERHPYQARPPRFDYLPTAKGRALQPTLAAATHWSSRYTVGTTDS
jgi:DNA-binding HxlR family transcriptional regulator